ncbi:MAG: hypothetical protein IJ445_06910 [Clostridia bacterium]|nr:hypothetical protein [Clostridia bacterium]
MKNKDPAFLFYTSDFLTGVTLMNYEQRGKYITLLCLQHQNGHLSEEDMLAICGKRDKKIFAKFVKDEEGLYYNERVDVEKEKRRKYTESQTKKVNKRWSQRRQNNTTVDTAVIPFENENEIDNEIILNSEVNKDNNITLVNNTNTFSFSNTNVQQQRAHTREDPPLKNQVVMGSESGAYLFITDAQIADLKKRLTEEEFDFYIHKMNVMGAKGYEFGCTHYEFILRMVEEDRKTRKE